MSSPAARTAFALVLLLVLSFLVWYSARTGYASLLTANALATGNLDAAKTAVGLSAGNPRTQVILGALLEVNDDRAAAMPHYQTAVNLRPQDYVLWMQLARGQELEGDTDAAINSGRVAVSLAPFYAQPHWQLGNMLVRAGRADGGFSELRVAGASDSTLLPGIIDLAWQLSGGKVEYVRQAIQPSTLDAYKALAAYFKKRDQVAAAIDMFKAGGSAMKQERSVYIGELIAARKFIEAHRLWDVDHPGNAGPDFGDYLVNPGFEQEAELDEAGFGWRAISLAKSVTLSLDTSDPRPPLSVGSSLRVDFNGESDPNAPIISQLVVLEPKTRYHMGVAFRTENLTSGGLPTILILDANDNKVLGQTEIFPQTTDGWKSTAIDFTSGETTRAIQIALQRKPCSTQQCPIFGKLWLDNFFLYGPNHSGEG